MSKYYKKTKHRDKKKLIRMGGILIFVLGLITTAYIFFPFLSWQIFFAPTFAAQRVANPIPKTMLVNATSLPNFLANNPLTGPDYNNAKNWFPNYVTKSASAAEPRVNEYTLTIPKLNIKMAEVTTVDNDLGSHLVNFEGTAIPPQKGNAVVFGHSTLPWLFNPNNYHTILANAYKLAVDDSMYATVNGTIYEYKIYNITVINPTDTSVLAQQSDDSYLTLITCTPPGTTEFRLVLRARLVKMH